MRRLMVICLFVAGASMPSSAHAQATLHGEFFSSYTSATITSGTCNPEGDSRYRFEISGQATGPYPGSFTETGSVTIGPQTEQIPGYPGQFRGPITSFKSRFKIVALTGIVRGTKSLSPISAPPLGDVPTNRGVCAGSAAQIIASTLAYKAKLPGEGLDQGFAFDNFNMYTAPAPTNTQYEFQAGFVSQ